MKKTHLPSMTVVIVNWNAAPLLRTCIDSVLAQEGLLVEVVVVDNASTDDSRDVLSEAYSSKACVTLLFAAENLGFSRGNNVGFQGCSSDFVTFLNPDTELLSNDTLSRLAGALDDTSIGLVGPLLRNVDGSLQQSCAPFPTLSSLAVTGFGLHFLMTDGLRRRYAPVAWSQSQSVDTDWLRGACLTLRTQDYRDIGGFSEETFMYADDLEIAYRIRERGMRVRYLSDAEVLHVDDYSSSQRWSDSEKAAKVVVADLSFLDRTKTSAYVSLMRIVMVLAYGGRGVLLPLIRRSERGRVYRAMARSAVKRNA